MKSSLKHLIVSLPVVAALAAPPLAVSVAHAATSPTDSSASASANNQLSAAETTLLSNIKTKGKAEIDRRLKTLNTLLGKISSNTKISASDKDALSTEVGDEITNLGTLRAKLDAETTIAGAVADVSSMVTEYRVYALIVPKMQLIRTADDQQIVQGKLSDLATKLASRITQAQNSGKDVSALSAKLAEMQSQITMGQAISAKVESSVLALQPTDFNSDHGILSGYRDQLKTAHTDNQTAYSDAKAIVAGLKNL